MSSEPIPMRMFLSTIAKWLGAVEHHQTDDAAFFIDELHAVGRMLASHPEFRRIYRSHQNQCSIDDSERAFTCMHSLLSAVTDAARLGRFG